MIGIADPRWCELFPHIVRPRIEDDESLLGLVLRCDDANGWPGGTTAFYCRREIAKNGGRLNIAGAYIVATCIGLKRLARGLGVDVADVERTTFLPELRRLHPHSRPDAFQLRPTPSFRVCPQCIREDKLLTRSLLLPYIGLCPRHDEVFVYTCRCGAPLEPFRRLSVPFACPYCGCAWADLRGEAAEADRLAANRRVVGIYGAMLSGYDATKLAIAAMHIRYALGTHRAARTINPDDAHRSMLPTFKMMAAVPGDGVLDPRDPKRLCLPSLPCVVASASALGLTADDLQEPIDQYRMLTPVCLNRACPLYSRQGMGNIMHRGGHQARYCDECGSCFTGNHIRLAFEFAGGDDEEVDTAGVREAQERLRAWKGALVAACEGMLADDETIAVNSVFKRAALPSGKHLKARRLGLVGIVKMYANRQEELRSKTASESRSNDSAWVQRVEAVPGLGELTTVERHEGPVLPGGSTRECPRCHETARQIEYYRNRSGSQQYRCGACGRVYTPAPMGGSRGLRHAPETRAEAVRRHRECGNFTHVARQLGVSTCTVTRWVAAAMYTAGLPDRPSQPDGPGDTAKSTTLHTNVEHKQG